MVNPLSYLQMFFKSVFSVFSPSTTTVWQNGIAYSLTLHNPRVLLYRGPETRKLESLSDRDTSSIVKATNVQLVQKGWIAGIVGWNAAGYMGVPTKRGWDITPVGTANWKDANAESSSNSISEQEQEDEDAHERASSYHDSKSRDSYEMQTLSKDGSSASQMTKETRHIATRRKEKIDKQIRSQSSGLDLSDSNDSTTRVLGTYKCRIPVSTGDGYFRLWVTFPSALSSSTKIALGSPTFRLFSFSLSSASPRGAALLPIPVIAPELVLRTVSIALTTLLYGLFPIATIIDKLLPRWVSRRFLNWIYMRTGAKDKTESLKNKYNVDQKVEQAREQVKKVPFASAGIRTDWDIERDQERGRGGWQYYW